MRKFWKRAAGIIKDRNSLWLSSLTRRSRYRNPEIQAAVIKATSHDDTFVDDKNVQRVFAWARTSPTHLNIISWALNDRVRKTKDWVVTLKCMILFHGILCTKAPGTRRIGRLPFDLSGFNDGSSQWTCNAFVQAYYEFVDLKSITLATEFKDEMVIPINGGEVEVEAQLVKVQRWQDLMDCVLCVRPQGTGTMHEIPVLEAMDYLIIEVFELYNKICEGIATALKKIYTKRKRKEDAIMALNVLQRATRQGHDLSDYFRFCTKFELLHATESPKIDPYPMEDIIKLERIINGEYEKKSNNYSQTTLVVVDKRNENEKVEPSNKNKPWLTTIITDKWVIFDEDIDKGGSWNESTNMEAIVQVNIDPFAASYNFPPIIQCYNPFIDHTYGCTNSHLIY